MSIHQTLFSAYPNPLIIVDSADFDGTNDVMTRGAALTGIEDSKTGILSLWCRIDAQDDATRRIFSCSTVQACQLNLTVGNNFQLIGQNATPTTILSLASTTAYIAGATWLHVLASWNLAVAGSGRLYITDVSDKSEVTYTDDTISYTGATDWSIGASTAGLADFDGCLAEVYFAPGQYLDFDIIANRRKFISVSGKPVHLGATGALPTGTAPIVYQSVANGAAVATFATNLGTGGNYSITGTLETGSTSPSD
ncbi:MAG: LamG-like jellyroll fold domain-containing protein [Candidatus Nanopelagicales bacterium]|nr:LamG-like jellyroll fold domain-containing protein [Candidatus Nanopelagicales bacterium]